MNLPRDVIPISELTDPALAALVLETVTFQREVQTADGAGGSRVAWVTVDTGRATRNWYRSARTNEERTEEGTHNAQGPGVVTETRQFLTFRTKVPKALPNDRALLEDGSTWLVLFVRDHSSSGGIDVQVDIELIR